jgi:hypothetical protein
MKKIPLTQGLFATVDDEDFDELNKFSWFALDTVVRGKKTHYAVRIDPKAGGMIYMQDEVTRMHR